MRAWHDPSDFFEIHLFQRFEDATFINAFDSLGSTHYPSSISDYLGSVKSTVVPRFRFTCQNAV